jgi:hypothetical protein
MRVVFENATERSNVIATLTRLMETINERSHSTAEEQNLFKAISVIGATPTKEELYGYTRD